MNYSCRTRMMLASCALLLLLASVSLALLPVRAASPYHITFSTSNFPLQTLFASADDLSNPGHVLFSLQNGTQFWYGLTVQSTPAGITPTQAHAGDLVTSTFDGAIPLLPPMGVLPFDQGATSLRYESLRLALAFSGPAQQVQIQLNPFESHAITLDVFTLLLQLLGYKNEGGEIGLLAPGGLALLFNDASTLPDLTTLVNDYTQALRSQSESSSTLSAAYACAKDVVALLTNSGEQHVLADLLWKLIGKTLPYDVMLKTINSFAGAQFGLGIEGLIRDESALMDAMLFQQSNPVVTLQSVSNTPTPTPSLPATSTVLPTTSPVPAKSPPASPPTRTATAAPTATSTSAGHP